MSLTAWILSAGFAALVALGMPFAFAIAVCVIAVLLSTGIEPMLLPQTRWPAPRASRCWPFPSSCSPAS